MQISTHRSHSARRGSSGMIILSRRAIAAFSWYTKSVLIFDGIGVLSSFSSVETAARTSAQSGLFEEPGVELRRMVGRVSASHARISLYAQKAARIAPTSCWCTAMPHAEELFCPRT